MSEETKKTLEDFVQCLKNSYSIVVRGMDLVILAPEDLDDDLYFLFQKADKE
jgi:hypothetical protein